MLVPPSPAGSARCRPQAAQPKAGQTINIAQQPNTAPTWIFPVIPAANSSVYTAFDFINLMWRPLYWSPVGTEQKIDPTLSIGNTPVWSNGNKTVKLTLKTNYKWPNGQAVSSKDVLFFYDMLKAAVKENPSNFGNYIAGLGIPDQVTSITAPNATTVQMTLNKPVNPVWFLDNELGLINPMPAYAWSKTSANGPIVDFTNPANAKKIYDFLAAQSKQVTKYTTDPLWKVTDGPYNLTKYNNTTGEYAMAPNPNYGGPHAKIVSPFDALPFTSDSAEWNAVKAGKVDIGYMPQIDVPQKDSIASTYNTYGVPGFGFSYIVYNFKNTTGDWNNIIKQLYFRQAIAHLQDEKGIINAFFHGAGTEAYGPIPSEPKSPYAPANASTNPYPFSVDAATSLLKNHGWTVNPGGTCRVPERGLRREPVRSWHPGRHQAGLQPDLRHQPGDHRPAGHRPGLAGEEGRHQHQAADQQLQLHDRQLPEPDARGQEEHQQVGDGWTSAGSALPPTRP